MHEALPLHAESVRDLAQLTAMGKSKIKKELQHAMARGGRGNFKRRQGGIQKAGAG